MIQQTFDMFWLLLIAVSLLLATFRFRKERTHCVRRKRLIGILGTACFAASYGFYKIHWAANAAFFAIFGCLLTAMFSFWFIDFDTSQSCFIVHIFCLKRTVPFADVIGITPRLYGGIVRLKNNKKVFADFTENWEQFEDTINWNYSRVLKLGTVIPDIPGKYYLGNAESSGEFLFCTALVLVLITIAALFMIPSEIERCFPNKDDYIWLRVETESAEIRDKTLYIKGRNDETVYSAEVSYILHEDEIDRFLADINNEHVVSLLVPKDHLESDQEICAIRSLQSDTKDYISFQDSTYQNIRAHFLGVCIFFVIVYSSIILVSMLYCIAAAAPGKHPVLFMLFVRKK